YVDGALSRSAESKRSENGDLGKPSLGVRKEPGGFLGASVVLAQEGLCLRDRFRGAQHIPVFERDSRRNAVRLGEIIAIAGALPVEDRRFDLATRIRPMPPRQCDARSHDTEMQCAALGRAGTQQTTSERNRVVGVIDEPKAQPELGEVCDRSCRSKSS